MGFFAQESEHSRGSMYFALIMETHPPAKIESSTLDALRTAYVLVVKRQNFHLDFLRISKETEERMAEPGFKTMFFYGL